MKIINTTADEIGIQPDLIVLAGGAVEIDNERLSALKALPSIKARFIAGDLVEDGAVEAPGVTREEISAMAKPDVIELLEAHGVEFDKRAGVDKLRALLIGIMFVDI